MDTGRLKSGSGKCEIRISHNSCQRFFLAGFIKSIVMPAVWQKIHGRYGDNHTDMLIADKRDYKNGYKKHYGLYKRLRKENSDINSRRLVLIYSVECGLKYMLLDRWHEDNLKRLLEGADENRKKVLQSHNLEKMVKELGQQGNFKFPQFETIHKDPVASDAYHQLYRYCIRVQEKEIKREEELEETLYSLAKWIEEGT